MLAHTTAGPQPDRGTAHERQPDCWRADSDPGPVRARVGSRRDHSGRQAPAAAGGRRRRRSGGPRARLDDIAEASKALSAALDSSDAVGAAAYTLEVSSRGVSRPLELPRHWRRNAGRLVEVNLAGGGQLTGRIVDSDDETVRLEVDGPSGEIALRRRGEGAGAGRAQPAETRTSRTTRGRGGLMDIDISVLRLMEREKDCRSSVLANAIEEALLTAYDKTDGAVPGARVELNRKTGHVSVMVPELDDDGQPGRRVRQHPRGLRPGGRVDRAPGDHAAAARRRGRAEVRPLRRRRGRHRLRRRAAGQRHPDGAGRPRQDRGDHAAGRAGAGGALRARHPDQGLRGRRSARSCADRRSWSRGPTPGWSRSCSSSRCRRSPTARSRSRPSPARPATGARSR